MEAPLSVARVFVCRPLLFWFQKPWKPPGLVTFWCNIMMNTVCPQATLCKGLSLGYCNNGYTAHDFSENKRHCVKCKYVRLALCPQLEAYGIVKVLAVLSFCYSCNWHTCVHTLGRVMKPVGNWLIFRLATISVAVTIDKRTGTGWQRTELLCEQALWIGSPSSLPLFF